MRMSNGATEPVTITNNAYEIYAAQTAPLPESISWRSGGQLHTASTNVPPDAATVKCAVPPAAP
ncbi:MAG TPA: hypothetical protein VNV42_16235 [Solirubrobacteraceae bacterium]|nr:hypothetical protein [Solirubrobacteraceae bacterium]